MRTSWKRWKLITITTIVLSCMVYYLIHQFYPIREAGVFSMPKPSHIQYIKSGGGSWFIVYTHNSHKNVIDIKCGGGVDDDYKGLKNGKGSLIPWSPRTLKGKNRNYDAIGSKWTGPDDVQLMVHPVEDSDLTIEFTGFTNDLDYFVSLLDRSTFYPDHAKNKE